MPKGKELTPKQKAFADEYVSATSLASGNPEFTAGTIPHSLSTGKEVL